MSDDELAFLRKIVSAPADDVARLAYCDWLEERDSDEECPECEGAGKRRYTDAAGDTDYRTCYSCASTGRRRNAHARRAEFIRVQIELAAMCDQDDEMAKAGISHFDYDRAKLNRRISSTRSRMIELWQGEHDGSWGNIITQLKPLLHGLWATITTRHPKDMPHAIVTRGFPSLVRCDMSTWQKYGADVVRYNPIERVEITDKEPRRNIDPIFSPTSGTPSYLHSWSSHGSSSSDLPREFWENTSDGLFVHFSTSRESAFNWLSQRCIETARAKANQPAKATS